MDEASAVSELVAAHADVERLTADLLEASKRRRAAARQLIELGRGTSWIARHLGVSPQAVDQFLKYKREDT
ncbi:helix-turn-helix domain-containing protein [Mycobacteroides abscessus]|uniref:helix-turn-helix domain-containing protein n=1 Tax=Mycobacteroides abscessus TaxID=36809 RepID=UPI00210332E4|nr:helix-turn-helix domain-containing protein [Mycobacteroides abscessus]